MGNSVLVENHDAVAVITLNNPQKRNALTLAFAEELAEALSVLQDTEGVRSLVLTGGSNFCSGGDLSALDAAPLAMRRMMSISQRVVRALTGGSLPVVAAVQGMAYGAGFSLAMACDFVVADVNASFCAAFGRVGLMPDYGLLWTLPQRVGIGWARKIVMLCERISGSEAFGLGLVDQLAEPGSVPRAAVDLALRLAHASPATISTAKSMLARQPLTLEAMLAWEADTQALLTNTADFSEGIRAFVNKCPPSFQGR